jgi:hypothetical protein
MDNHLHLLLRIDPEVASNWSDSEVVERWFRLFPPRGSDRKPMKVSKEMVAAREKTKRTGTAIDGHCGFGKLFRLFRFFVLEFLL